MVNTSKLIKIALVVLALFVVYKVATTKRTQENFDAVFEPFEGAELEEEEFTGMDANETLPPGWAPTQRALPSPPPMSTAAQLLPKSKEPEADDFSQFAPKALQGVNLLEASQFLGVDTQGSSLKLSSHDLRGYPVPNPRDKDWGPVNNSTYSADLMRKTLQ